MSRQQGFNVFFIPLKMKILLEIKMIIPGSGLVGSPTVSGDAFVNIGKMTTNVMEMDVFFAMCNG